MMTDDKPMRRDARTLHDEVWARGIESEVEVIEYLAQHYDSCVASNRMSNIKDDIDCWVTHGGTTVGVSIKTEHRALETGNFSFELRAYDRRRGGWIPSWYHDTKADKFVIRVGSTLYLIDVEELHFFVMMHGWDAVRELTGYAKYCQSKSNRTNSQNGLLSIKRCLDYRLATVLGEIPQEVT